MEWGCAGGFETSVFEKLREEGCDVLVEETAGVEGASAEVAG